MNDEDVEKISMEEANAWAEFCGTGKKRMVLVDCAYRVGDTSKYVFLFKNGRVCEVLTGFVLLLISTLGSETAWLMFELSLKPIGEDRYRVVWPPKEIHLDLMNILHEGEPQEPPRHYEVKCPECGKTFDMTPEG
jgi:hypothetical protein